MARSFEDGEGDKHNDDNKRNYSHPQGAALPLPPPPPPPPIVPNGSAVGGQLLALPAPPPTMEVIEDIVEEGRHLYMDFIRTEISRSGLRDACIDHATEEESIDPQKVLQWIRAGRELRQLADAFSKSKEREAVREKAENVAVESLDIDHFVQLLQELFLLGGITRERVIVLFFFCADVAIKALREGLHNTFHRLVEWSLRYIATHVAAWVHTHGGWGNVFRSSLDVMYQLSASMAFIAIFAACVVYIRRNSIPKL